MRPRARVLARDGAGSPFIDHEHRVRLWKLAAEADPSQRASTSIPQMDAIARQVCVNAGGDTDILGEKVATILAPSRNHFEQDELGHVHQQATKIFAE